MKKFKEDPNKTILIEAFKSRRFLRIHGFITDNENDKLLSRLCKFQKTHKVIVSPKELE